MIKAGDLIRIKDNIRDELLRYGFDEKKLNTIIKKFKDKSLMVLSVSEYFVVIDLCYEIPITACEKID